MTSWYKPPAFKPIKYIPRSEEITIRAKPVFALHAVGHSKIPGPYAGERTNHWCVYLQTSASEDDEYVCVNAVPNPQQAGTAILGGFKADVIVSLLHGAVDDATHKVEIPVAEGLTVGLIVDLLAQAGRDRYEFTVEGVGCRRWTTDTLALLAQQKWLVSSEAVALATADTLKLWPEGTLLAIDNGVYY
jgi:hypothetical protein